MQSEFEKIEEMLKTICVPMKSKTNNRRHFPVRHRAITLGETRGRFNGLRNSSPIKNS
jgi:hypothetical protein